MKTLFLFLMIAGFSAGLAAQDREMSYDVAVATYKPVSYTHLDVYKRQNYNRAKYFINTKSAFEKKDWQGWQIKNFILNEGTSKYKANFSPQLALF